MFNFVLRTIDAILKSQNQIAHFLGVVFIADARWQIVGPYDKNS